MANEIIMVCNSINNKNIRSNELNILRKHEDELYFEFGESEMNIKKRFYKDIETLNKDFERVKELKENPIVKEEQKEVKTINNDEEKTIENAKTEKIKIAKKKSKVIPNHFLKNK